VLGIFGATVFGFWLGRGPVSTAVAAPPPPPAPEQKPALPASDWDKRVVAYIYNSIPVTREDLGEYLIARMKHGTLETLVNQKIIDVACQKRGITVTQAEIEATLMRDLDTIKVNKKQFVDNVLSRKGMTLFEYENDVLRHTVLMTKLVKDRLPPPGDDELHRAFDAAYGEKRECRIIIWPKAERAAAFKEYDLVRKDEQGFDQKARAQAIGHLAATGGRIKPIAHNSGVHAAVEKAAFTLQPGEVSSLIETEEGIVVLKIDKAVPPDTSVKFAEKQDELRQQVFDKNVATEIPKMFLKLREEANPKMILKMANDLMAVERDAEHELRQDGMLKPAGGTAPR
jgi:parvulin-like peptidyl-prolyl isomerase